MRELRVEGTVEGGGVGSPIANLPKYLPVKTAGVITAQGEACRKPGRNQNLRTIWDTEINLMLAPGQNRFDWDLQN